MYIKFNDDGSYGFYLPEFHGEEIINHPDYIEITDDAYQMLMENQGLKTLPENARNLPKIGLRNIVDVPENEPSAPSEEEQKREQTEIVLQMFARALPDEEALKVPLVFAEWQPDIDYVAGDVLRYDSELYRVIQPHRSQADWTPDVALTVFSRVSRPGEIPAWKQGSYTKGMKVTHNGFTWESIIDNNVWEPGIVDETIWKKII